MLAVGLDPSSPKTVHTKLTVAYMSRGSLIVVDSIVLVLTWNKTFSNWNEARRLGLDLSVSTCLLRDGKYLCIIPHACSH